MTMKQEDDVQYYEVETYEDLIGTTVNGIYVTEAILERAKNKCVGDKRRKKSLDIAPDESFAAVLTLHVQRDDVIHAIASANNLKVKQPDMSVKFDDVRDMDLSLDNWETYRPEEKKFAQCQLSAYNDYYDLDAPNDKTGIYDVIDLEVRMQTIRLYIRLSKKKDEILEYDKQLKELRLQWSKALDDLALKKKQRDVAKPKLIDTSNDLSEAIKSLDEMQAEAEQRKLEIQKKKLEKNKHKKRDSS